MRVLLVDIGNTRIKWALWRDGRLGRQRAIARADGGRTLVRDVLKGARKAERVAVVSVGGKRVDRQFAAEARRTIGVAPRFVVTERRAAGITTRYTEPWRLGVDRFVAAIGAHHIAKSRAVCVVDVGTAMTIDLIDAQGQHHGGAIVPGPQLMTHSLLRNTSGIERRARGGRGGGELFARSTRAAVEQGSRHAAAAIVDRAEDEARRVLGIQPIVLLTGGAAEELRPLIRCSPVLVPDLVLRGLAVLVGLALD